MRYALWTAPRRLSPTCHPKYTSVSPMPTGAARSSTVNASGAPGPPDVAPATPSHTSGANIDMATTTTTSTARP